MTELLIRDSFKMWLIGKTKRILHQERRQRKREKEKKIEQDMRWNTSLSIGTQVLAGVILLRKYTVIRLT